MQLFFHPDATQSDKEIKFSKEESRHIVKVLRKGSGDLLHLTNGQGLIFKTEIKVSDPNQCRAVVLGCEQAPPAPYFLHLAVAPTKMNDRYEWFLEKATEIGIQEITPIICDHSERKVVKTDRYRRVILSALKQSLHTHLPILNEPLSFSEFLEREAEGNKLIAHCEEDQERKMLARSLEIGIPTTVLIGPEGDFSFEEIKAAREKGWEAVSLGNSRLRTETAAIVACHTVALKHELG